MTAEQIAAVKSIVKENSRIKRAIIAALPVMGQHIMTFVRNVLYFAKVPAKWVPPSSQYFAADDDMDMWKNIGIAVSV